MAKNGRRATAEYALRDTRKPIGIAEYQLVQALPARMEANLPTVRELQRELGPTRRRGRLA